MTTEELIDKLRSLNACKEAIEWAATEPDAETAWTTCERGDWLFWLIAKMVVGPYGSESHRKVAFLAALSSAQEWQWMGPDGRNAIELVIRFGQGETIDINDLRRARNEAWGEFYSPILERQVAAALAARSAFVAADLAIVIAYSNLAMPWREVREYADLIRMVYPEPPRLP
jgi:hypothetical protein